MFFLRVLLKFGSPMGLPAPDFASLAQLHPAPMGTARTQQDDAQQPPLAQPQNQSQPVTECQPPRLTEDEWAQVHLASEQAQTEDETEQRSPQNQGEQRQPPVAIDVDIRASLASQQQVLAQHDTSPKQQPPDDGSDTHSSDRPSNEWSTWPQPLREEMRQAARQLAALADLPGTFEVSLAQTILAEVAELAVSHLAGQGQQPLQQPLGPQPVRGHALRTDLFPSLREADKTRLAAAATGLRHRLNVVPSQDPASLQPIFDAMANETAFLYQNFWGADHSQYLQAVASTQATSIRSPSPMPQGSAPHISQSSQEMLQAVRLPVHPPRPTRYSSRAEVGLYKAMDALTSRHSAMLLEKVLPGGATQAWYLTDHCPQTEAAKQSKQMLATLRAVPAAADEVLASLTLAKATLAQLGDASPPQGAIPPLMTHTALLASGPQGRQQRLCSRPPLG